MQQLLEIMARLQDPERDALGIWSRRCVNHSAPTPWEAYEVAHAIQQVNSDLRMSSGICCSRLSSMQMASENGAFGFDEIVSGISEKWCAAIPMCSGGKVAGVAAQAKPGSVTRPPNALPMPGCRQVNWMGWRWRCLH